MSFRPLALPLLLALTLTLRADDQTSALINQALDKKVAEMSLDALLPAAMETITQQTDVPVKADPAVWDMLPWGRDTSIKAKIENQPLRDTLDAITRKLGLRWELRNGAVVVEPMPALRRLARRATVQELGCMDALTGTPFDASGPMTAKDLLDAIDAKLQAAKTSYVIDRPAPDVAPLDGKVEVARNSTALDALNKLAAQTDLTWYPWGKSVVVLTKNDQIRRQLGRTITARYNGVDLTQVLNDLSQKAGVKFDIEAGALLSVPPESRSIQLVIEDYSVLTALDSLRGVTGLDYSIKGDSVYFWNNTPTGAQRDRVTLMMPIRGTDMTAFVPESEVPADLREYVKAKKAKAFDDIRQLMHDEGFKPAGPATAPAATQPAKGRKSSDQDL